jgi:hypothetical protein
MKDKSKDTISLATILGAVLALLIGCAIATALSGCSEPTEFPEQEICNDMEACGMDYNDCMTGVIGTCRKEAIDLHNCTLDNDCDASQCEIEAWVYEECKGVGSNGK